VLVRNDDGLVKKLLAEHGGELVTHHTIMSLGLITLSRHEAVNFIMRNRRLFEYQFTRQRVKYYKVVVP